MKKTTVVNVIVPCSGEAKQPLDDSVGFAPLVERVMSEEAPQHWNVIERNCLSAGFVGMQLLPSWRGNTEQV